MGIQLVDKTRFRCAQVDAFELVLGGGDAFLELGDLALRLAQRQARRHAMARHGVISAGAQTPESLAAPSWRFTPPSFSSHSRYGTPVTGPPADASTSLREGSLLRCIIGYLRQYRQPRLRN
jgi:hypothetical protein